MTEPMTHAEQREILELLDATDRGYYPLSANAPWDSDCRTIEYRIAAPGGCWLVEVFNDAGGWDYLDTVTAPDGRSWNLDDGPIQGPVFNWRPKTNRWGYVAVRGFLHCVADVGHLARLALAMWRDYRRHR